MLEVKQKVKVRSNSFEIYYLLRPASKEWDWQTIKVSYVSLSFSYVSLSFSKISKKPCIVSESDKVNSSLVNSFVASKNFVKYYTSLYPYISKTPLRYLYSYIWLLPVNSQCVQFSSIFHIEKVPKKGWGTWNTDLQKLKV